MTATHEQVADMFRLDNRVAILTGGSSGLGVAFTMAQVGADVTVVGRREARLNETAERIRGAGGKAQAATRDVTDPDQCSRTADRVTEEMGHLDIVVNNAGTGSAKPATREAPQEFQDVVSTNLFGTYWMARAAGRVMAPGSSIVNFASVLAFTTAGLPQAAYASSKAAVAGLTRDLAQQWSGRKGIRVNAVAPGFFETEMTEAYDKAYVENYLSPHIVLGRAGSPVECRRRSCGWRRRLQRT